jgi:hypothetical protein
VQWRRDTPLFDRVASSDARPKHWGWAVVAGDGTNRSSMMTGELEPYGSLGGLVLDGVQEAMDHRHQSAHSWRSGCQSGFVQSGLVAIEIPQG